MDRLFKLPGSTFIGGNENVLSLREILKRLEVCVLFLVIFFTILLLQKMLTPVQSKHVCFKFFRKLSLNLSRLHVNVFMTK